LLPRVRCCRRAHLHRVERALRATVPRCFGRHRGRYGCVHHLVPPRACAVTPRVLPRLPPGLRRARAVVRAAVLHEPERRRGVPTSAGSSWARSSRCSFGRSSNRNNPLWVRLTTTGTAASAAGTRAVSDGGYAFAALSCAASAGRSEATKSGGGSGMPSSPG